MNAQKLFEAGFVDLVSVAPPGASLSPASNIKPDALGKAPARLGGAGWAGYDWRRAEVSLADARTMDRTGASIGLRARTFPALDIDVLDEDLAAVVERLALEILGPAPCRVGRAPKRLLAYRCSAPFGRMRLWLTESGGKRHLVEMLADGQQYVIAGTHATTGRPYEWDADLCALTPMGLREIDRDKVQVFFEALESEVDFLGLKAEREGTGAVSAVGDAPAQESLRAPSLDLLASAVAAMPNDAANYEEYIAVGIAIKAAGSADEGAALQIYQAWAARWPDGDNDPQNVARDWARMRSPYRIGWDWLSERAARYGFNAAGWEFPVESVADVVEVESRGTVEYTDAAMAARLVLSHSHEAKHCEALGGWLTWDGSRWAPDETMLVADWTGTMLQEAAREVLARGDYKAERATKVAERLSSVSARNNCEAYARSDRRVNVRAEQFDSDPMLLNTPGGIVDLRTGVLRDRHRGELVMRVAGAVPDRRTRPVAWLEFLSWATGGDDELLGYLRRLIGYCLTGQTQEQHLSFLFGPGGTGKSVFAGLVASLLGDYAVKSQMETFVASAVDRHPTELARLRGARLVWASETQDGRRWAEGRVKELTGGEPVTARFLHRDEFTYVPQFKLVFLGNHRPAIRNVESGIRRRLHVVPFTRPPAVVDQTLPERLRAELPAIMGWAVEACLEWQRDGLRPPQVVVDATDDYCDEEDVFGRWIEDCCTTGVNDFAALTELFESWRGWAVEQGEFVGSAKRLSAALKQRGLQSVRARDGRAFRGLAVRLGPGQLGRPAGVVVCGEFGAGGV